LAKAGVEVTPDRLRVSSQAHVIFEHHKVVDRLNEKWKGDGRIGTTGRGIGPAYADKASRTGLRLGDLVEPERLRARLLAALSEKNAVIEHVHGEKPLDVEAQIERAQAVAARLAPFLSDTGAEVRDAYGRGERVLFEGAQGVMLDLDAGTYPYVTSSSTGVSGIGSGAGFPPQKIDRAFGIAKAYCTRVGEGPFPSEETGGTEQRIRDAGNEYGATTGRPRRCGWLDAVALRYALELNGADGWIMTNLDVLTGFDEISIATRYRRGTESFERFPAHLGSLDDVTVETESAPGWTEDITGVRSFEDLPERCRKYVEWVEEKVGTPIVMLSVGPSREQVIPRGASLGVAPVAAVPGGHVS
ncbi:MAG: adenylosuccinate synthase, partial [Planctomycetota bacterium]